MNDIDTSRDAVEAEIISIDEEIFTTSVEAIGAANLAPIQIANEGEVARSEAFDNFLETCTAIKKGVLSTEALNDARTPMRKLKTQCNNFIRDFRLECSAYETASLAAFRADRDEILENVNGIIGAVNAKLTEIDRRLTAERHETYAAVFESETTLRGADKFDGLALDDISDPRWYQVSMTETKAKAALTERIESVDTLVGSSYLNVSVTAKEAAAALTLCNWDGLKALGKLQEMYAVPEETDDPVEETPVVKRVRLLVEIPQNRIDAVCAAIRGCCPDATVTRMAR